MLKRDVIAALVIAASGLAGVFIAGQQSSINSTPETPVCAAEDSQGPCFYPGDSRQPEFYKTADEMYYYLPEYITPCEVEDAVGPCFWDAAKQGNGKGHSFFVDSDQNLYFTGSYIKELVEGIK